MVKLFGETLHECIKARGFSLASVAEDLGYKSKTTLVRILEESSKIENARKCFELALNSELLDLTQAERQALQTALEVSAIGKQAFMTKAVLHDILHPTSEPLSLSDIAVEGIEGIRTFEQLLQRCSKSASCTVWVFGPQNARIFSGLYRLSDRMDRCEIRHYFALDAHNPDDLKTFNAISSIMFSNAYTDYVVNESDAIEKNWMFRSGMLLIEYEEDSGCEEGNQFFSMARVEENQFLGAKDAEGAIASFWLRYIAANEHRLMPLKADVRAVSMLPFPHNYIAFTDYYRQLEHNREIYMIIPDVPFNCISVELLWPIMMEGFAQGGAGRAHDVEKIVGKLAEIHKARYDNLFQKKKVTNIILNTNAMFRFAKTGVCKDQFFLSRPYTCAERVEILEHLLHQTKTNPYFNIRFSNESSIVNDKEVTTYGECAVAIINANTSWNLEKDHSEVLLYNEVLAKYVRDYFRQELMRHEVLPSTKGEALLEQMIAVAAKCRE